MQRAGCGRSRTEAPRWGQVAANCRVCIVSRNLQSGHTPGVGGLSRRLLNRATPYVAAAGHSPSSAMGRTAVPPTPLHRTSVSPRALSGTLSFRRRVFAGNPHHRRGFPVPQAAPPKSIMSTVLPNTPIPRSKERMLGCWGGKGAHHEHQQGIGGRKPQNALEATWKDLAAENSAS